VEVPVRLLRPAPDNPRESLLGLDELAASISSVGLLQPLVVTPATDGAFTIVCGARRWAAARRAGLPSLPCLVRELTERERVEMMLVENVQRATLSKLEEARGYARLVGLGYTQRQVAARVGKSAAHVCRRLLLLGLPAEVQLEVESSRLPVDRALGYRQPAEEEVFAVDEQLQKAWLALRAEVIASGDRRLVRLLREFAEAYLRLSDATSRGRRRSRAEARMERAGVG
jgi:ParB family transcriptional regulator, chromosome partitioning protein